MNIRVRLDRLESARVKPNNNEETRILGGAIERILKTLRLVLSDDKTRTVLADNGFSNRIIIDHRQKYHWDKMRDLASRIEGRTTTEEDQLIFTSISPNDLKIYGSLSAEEVVLHLVELEQRF